MAEGGKSKMETKVKNNNDKKSKNDKMALVKGLIDKARKNNTLICSNRVRSISPMTTLSYPGGITATLAASKPASKISRYSFKESTSSPSKSTIF